MASRSATDEAYDRYIEYLGSGMPYRHDAPQLTEADTRAKLIDPLFQSVLGWTETEIRREKPVDSGYVDYVFGADFAYLLVEAKRTKPRFSINVPSRARELKLGGPHLLGNKKIKAFIHQAQSYAISLGAQFAMLANGEQLVVFRPFLSGQSWSDGFALVWHATLDIKQDFQEFYNLLARDRVVEGALVQAFERLGSVTTQLHVPLDYVADADRELVRNRFWGKIAQVMGPLLSDDPSISEDIIRHCYVTTPISDQVDAEIDALLRDDPPRFLLDSGVKPLRQGMAGKTGFEHDITSDIKSGYTMPYILTGGVGSGKTTFLKRFAMHNRNLVQEYCVWLYLDFRPLGDAPIINFDQDLQSYALRAIREEMARSYPELLPTSGGDVRSLFERQLADARMTLLHGLDPESREWQQVVNELVDRCYRDDAQFVEAILASQRRRGLRIVLVFDNTDQLGEAFQERVFLWSQHAAQQYGALCVVALREERYFAAFRRGIFDAFGERRFHLGSPDLGRVVFRRLQFGRTRLGDLIKSGAMQVNAAEANEIDTLLGVVIRSTTRSNTNVVRMLSCVSNGDMRHALDMFRWFISSGNTNIHKILSACEQGSYTVPFHEFAKSAILGARRFFRGSVSHTVNLFKQTEARGASHATAVRLLARLCAAQGAASSHGEGFVDTKKLLREYRESFGTAEDLLAWCGELLRRGLIESEPPRVDEARKADAIRVTAAGAYYWRYLSRSFAYLDLVFVDTPIADRDVARRLGALAENTDMRDRFERVRLFLGYLQRQEERELAESSRRSGPYTTSLMGEIRQQVDRELREVGRKVGV